MSWQRRIWSASDVCMSVWCCLTRNRGSSHGAVEVNASSNAPATPRAHLPKSPNDAYLAVQDVPCRLPFFFLFISVALQPLIYRNSKRLFPSRCPREIFTHPSCLPSKRPESRRSERLRRVQILDHLQLGCCHLFSLGASYHPNNPA